MRADVTREGDACNRRGGTNMSAARPPRLRALRPRQPRITKDQPDPADPDPEDQARSIKGFEEVATQQIDPQKRTAESCLDRVEHAEQDEQQHRQEMDPEVEVEQTAMVNNGGDPGKALELDGELEHDHHQQQQRNYICDTCRPSRSLPNLKAYLDHLKKEHKQKGKLSREAGNRCPACSYVALNSRDLENHQRVHHLKRRFFRCAKCSYVTHVRARYTKHVKYHSMPMIKCDSCDFRTPYKWNLDRHTRNHGGGGAFQCRACNFTADIRQSLTVHETNHHEPPVSQGNRKNNSSYERRPRNSPKRYNQVGASDFRETLNMSGSSTASASTGDSFLSDHSMDEKRTAIANAECIALKCEEKGCQFITAWDSEMQRHLAECHGPSLTPSKSRKPLPMLIPLSPVPPAAVAQKPNNGPSTTTLLKVPRVRVRPELAQIARDTELARLYGSKEQAGSGLKKDAGSAADLFEKKNASFFDKLKEKLTSATSINNGVPEVAVSSVNDLKCWCTFKASSMEELACHKQTHHTALSVSVGTTRCPRCRRRCKTTTDLQLHMQRCHTTSTATVNSNDTSADSSLENITNCSQARMNPYSGEYALAAHMDPTTWDVNIGGLNSSGSSVEQQSWDDQNLEERSVEESNNTEEPPTKLLIMNSKEYLQTTEVTATSVSILSSNEVNHNNGLSIGLRPPPALKVANKNKGQSLLKTSPIAQLQNSGTSVSVSTTTTTDESKRTLWKCKRCNYRDSNKETVVLHVKSHYESVEQSSLVDRGNAFGCGDCPFSAPDAASLSVHRVHHRPNLEAIFKCYLCPYYVSTKAELLDHVRLHGEELAVVHQQNTEYHTSPSKCKIQISTTENSPNRLKEEKPVEQVIHITTQTNVTTVSNSSSKSTGDPPPLLFDTRALPEAPLVWVSRPDGTLAKMLKCRHCPYISCRRAEVRDHETMHVDSPSQGPIIACTDCSFTCTRREVMVAHTDMHSGSLGTVHCLVDNTRPDSQQLNDLAALLGFTHSPVLGPEPDLRDSRLVHCCSKCPARFLCEKELRIHLRYHSTELAYSCQWCSYAARQPAHLLAHQKAHSMEYQERTKYLLSLYGNSQRYAPPATACVEAGTQDGTVSTPNIAWIVVEVSENSSHSFGNRSSSPNQRTGNQVFTCAKCPARYFKLDALEYHMTLHGSNNRFKCTECDYSSKTGQNLVKHQVVHRRQTETSEVTATSLSSQPDPQFGLFMRGNPNFVYPGYLRNGRLKEKRYKCHKCPSAFEKREQYRVHLTLHGAKQRYRCDTCDYSVKYYANYIQHLKKHQANAEAQASRRQFEDDTITIIDNDNVSDAAAAAGTTAAGTPHRSGKTLKSSSTSILASPSGPNGASLLNYGAAQASNQDKQSLMLMQKKGILLTGNEEAETHRCQSCPFSTADKEAMDAHKRRHGIERMTPSCPHCDYIPRKDENVGEHIRLHFTRLYKPESYLIIELFTLTMKKVTGNGKEENEKQTELLFKEYGDGRFFPLADTKTVTNSSTVNAYKEKVIVDPNTGETKHHLTV